MRSMFPKKMRAAALVLMLAALTGCGAQSAGQAKILEEEVKTTSANLKTAQAQVADLHREYSMSANVVYAKKYVVRLQADDAQFVEHMVNVGQEVKAGDVISVFRKQGDNIRLTAISLELDELDAEREDGLADRAEQMEALQERIDDKEPDANGYISARGSMELQIMQMEMEKLRLEQEQFLLRLDERERLLKAERSKLKQAEEDLVVTAPVDGFVSSLQYMTPGKACSRGQQLMVINDPAQVMLVAEAGVLGQFRMGQPVTIQYGRGNAAISVKGHVVASDNVLPTEFRTGKAYIMIDESLSSQLIDGAQIMSALQVSASARVTSVEMELQNVLLVPRDAVQFDNSKPYTELVEGTGSVMRYVQAGPNDGENIMILAGLDEGETVIVK